MAEVCSTCGLPAADCDCQDGPEIPDRSDENEAVDENEVVDEDQAGDEEGERHRAKLTSEMEHAMWIREFSRTESGTDVERLYDRLEFLLEERYHPREDGETIRQYLDTIGADDAAFEIARVYEQSQYAGTITDGAVDDAVEAFERLVSKE